MKYKLSILIDSEKTPAGVTIFEFGVFQKFEGLYFILAYFL